MGDLDAAKQLAVIYKDAGVFYLEGHGLTPDEIDCVFRESRAFFALPTEQKARISDKVMSRGYTAMQEETLDPANQTEGDTKEGYYIGRDIPKEDPRVRSEKAPQTKPVAGNSVLPGFRPTMENYLVRLPNLAMNIVRLITLGLDLKESHFDEDFRDSIATLRLLHYAQKESSPEQGIYACGAPSDYGIVTLLLTDENPGLQICRSITREKGSMSLPGRIRLS